MAIYLSKLHVGIGRRTKEELVKFREKKGRILGWDSAILAFRGIPWRSAASLRPFAVSVVSYCTDYPSWELG